GNPRAGARNRPPCRACPSDRRRSAGNARCRSHPCSRRRSSDARRAGTARCASRSRAARPCRPRPSDDRAVRDRTECLGRSWSLLVGLLVQMAIIAGNAGRKTRNPACALMHKTTDARMAAPRQPDLLGHPTGLTVLFATEMWERFSYYGMASLLVLYLVKHLLLPGQVEAVLGYRTVKAALESVFGPLGPQPLASQIFGFYAGFAYLLPIGGGYLADRIFGQRRMAIIGALLIAAGHFLMAVESLLFVALGLLVLGMGAFKPNVSTQVGALYAPGDGRRVRAYS